ncbi:MAG TPA: hypothetical protein VLL97_15185 [Acidobacteriota bacterium]|nr:hypothetical protein [Acidobacteriota bacterium]
MVGEGIKRVRHSTQQIVEIKSYEKVRERPRWAGRGRQMIEHCELKLGCGHTVHRLASDIRRSRRVACEYCAEEKGYFV